MRSFERHATILSLLQSKEHATMDMLAAACSTSVQTIRRDIKELGRTGRVTRFHGGARLAERATATVYDAGSNMPEKKSAARLVAELVPNGASVFLGGGSTLALAAEGLRKREGLTIVTNNLHAAIALYDRSGWELHVVGGRCRIASGSIAGEGAVESVERFKVDIAVVSTSGIDVDGTLLEHDQSLVAVMKSMLSNSRKKILVADSSKFKSGGVVRGLHLRDFDTLVTDRPPPPPVAAMLSAHGVALHCAR
jgi:DeoR family glycerol-3-phosphate regulon repressor